jgi:hypothetical protein
MKQEKIGLSLQLPQEVSELTNVKHFPHNILTKLSISYCSLSLTSHTYHRYLSITFMTTFITQESELSTEIVKMGEVKM